MYSLKRTFRKMNWRVILNLLGYVLIAEGLLLILPLLVSILYGENTYLSFLITIALCLGIGFALSRMHVKHSAYFARDGMIAVGLSWIVVSIVGGLPFFISGEIPDFVDCFFETVSGFTTTGSSILTDVEALTKGMLFWRSFTHWIGGMGVLVFILAFLPKSNERTMHVMRAEVPGPTIGKLVPRLKRSAMILYELYMALTILQIILLLFGGMPLFDSLVNTFGTAGTGGFAIKNLSIGYYNNVYFEMVITVFMLLFGINFNLYYFLALRDFKQVFKDEEMKVYLGIVAASIILIAVNTLPLYDHLMEAFRFSSFQVASVITTTGYSSTDFNLWPTFSKAILLLLMVTGACAGSTGGGVKISRILIIVKKIKLDLQRLIHPQKVEAITLNGKVVHEQTVNQIMSFFCCYLFIMAACFLIISLDGFDMETTISSVFACISNIGPGLGLSGPMGNFAGFSHLSKLVLSGAMLIGRLEIYPIIIFLLPLFQLPKRRRH